MAGTQEVCDLCKTVVNDEDIPLQEQFRLTIDIKATLVNKPSPKENKEKKKKEEKEQNEKERKERKAARDDKIEELTRKVSALRNAGGGALFVHLVGLSPNDRCLAFFNEYVDDTLTKLIEDGVLFVDTYSKIWLSERTEIEAHREFLLLIVKSSPSLTTADFKTKVTSDENLTRPTTLNIQKLLFSEQQQEVQPPTLRRLTPFIQEGRDIEFKSFDKTPFAGIITHANHTNVVEYIWKDLRLREYISCFTKIQGGGSYFLGIGESVKHIADYNYQTKTNIHSGIQVDPTLHETVKKGLRELIKERIIVRSGNSSSTCEASSLVTLEFHEVNKDTDEDEDEGKGETKGKSKGEGRSKGEGKGEGKGKGPLYILEVAVGYTPGCVFYDMPEVYTMVEGTNDIKPVELSEWLEKVKTFQPAAQSN